MRETGNGGVNIQMINNNGEITKELKEGLGLSELTGYPREVAKTIVPTFEVNQLSTQPANIVIAASSSTTGPQIAYTTEAGKDFYLTSVEFRLNDDAASDCTGGAVYCVTDNTPETDFIHFTRVAGAATQLRTFQNYTPPIKLKRQTNVRYTSSYTAGANTKLVTLTGFYLNNSGSN